jgi:hypothetical protein
MVKEGVKIDEEAPEEVVVGVLPKIELFEPALWAVSPDGAKRLVLRLAGCSALALAFRLEKGEPVLEAGVAED